MQRRLMHAPGRSPGGRALQPVYELIVTVADASPGADTTTATTSRASWSQDYVRAAHRHGALLLLDLQTGRSPFPVVAKRWAWALQKPWVGLALDPEWRMGPHQVPATVDRLGARRRGQPHLGLALTARAARHSLPEKLFVLHQFRLSMLPDIGRIVHRPGLAMVQHTDGFGTRGQKLATYHAVARPHQFRQGFKLFYHWDIHRFTPQQVRRIRPDGQLRQLPVTGAGARRRSYSRISAKIAKKSTTMPAHTPSHVAPAVGWWSRNGYGYHPVPAPWARITTSHPTGQTAVAGTRPSRRAAAGRRPATRGPPGRDDEVQQPVRDVGPRRAGASSLRSRNQCTSPVTVMPLIAAVRTTASPVRRTPGRGPDGRR